MEISLMLSSYLLVIGLLVADASPEAAPRAALEVEIELAQNLGDREARRSNGKRRRAVLTATPLPPTTAEPQASPVEAIVPGIVRLRVLPETDHLLTVSGEAWAPPVRLPAVDLPKRSTILASRTGTVRSRLVDATGGELQEWPLRVRARFHFLSTPLDVGREESFRLECPVRSEQTGEEERRSALCSLPEGTLDLRLEAEGFIPTYVWGLKVSPDSAADIADYRLERGASLIGLALRDDDETAAGAEVVISPAVAGATARAALAGRSSSLEYRAVVGERGFFQVRGLPEGAFDLRLSLDGYGLATIPPVQIGEPVEHELGEAVMIPYFPEAVVVVDPGAAPDGGPWTVVLFDPGGDARRAMTDAKGAVRFDLLPPGGYLLIVEDGKGQRWHAQEIELGPKQPRVDLTVEKVSVVGRVLLGEEPLSATLYFGGRNGSESIKIESGPDGELAGILPREGRWALDVRAQSPKVHYRVRELNVEVDPGLGAAELTIDVPANSIEGRVVDENGKPVPAAQVIFLPTFREARTTQVETEMDGSFVLAGLKPGEYRLKAVARGSRSSRAQILELDEGEPARPVELVVADLAKVDGRVVSPRGRGIPGAVIWPIREVAAPPPLDPVFRQVTTGPNGGFRLELGPDSPPGVAVVAPGYPLALARVPSAGSSLPWTVPLDAPETAGRLAIPGIDGPRRGRATLTKDGRWVLPIGLLTRRGAAGTGGRSIDSSVLSGLPPGVYEVCAQAETDSPRCKAGFLSAGGFLRLGLPEERP